MTEIKVVWATFELRPGSWYLVTSVRAYVRACDRAWVDIIHRSNVMTVHPLMSSSSASVPVFWSVSRMIDLDMIAIIKRWSNHDLISVSWLLDIGNVQEMSRVTVILPIVQLHTICSYITHSAVTYDMQLYYP